MSVDSNHTVPIRPWVDPVVDECGHDPRSPYVEMFWLRIDGSLVTGMSRILRTRVPLR